MAGSNPSSRARARGRAPEAGLNSFQRAGLAPRQMRDTTAPLFCLSLRKGRSMRPSQLPPLCALLSLALLAGCIGHMPALRAGQIGTISGRQTAGLANDAAQKKVLAEAAQQTVDHGFRYFVILPAPPPATPGMAARPAPPDTVIRPGMDVRFQGAQQESDRPRHRRRLRRLQAPERAEQDGRGRPIARRRPSGYSFASQETTASISRSVMSLVLACMMSLVRTSERKSSICFFR